MGRLPDLNDIVANARAESRRVDSLNITHEPKGGTADETPSISNRSGSQHRGSRYRQARDRSVDAAYPMEVDCELAKIARHDLRRL